MRVFLGIIWLVFWVAPAFARPIPPPPSDFRGDIYVDSRGCVFNRDDHKWLPRKVDGQQICGFPPSLSTLRLEIPQEEIHPPTMVEVEQNLLGVLASELRQGDLGVSEGEPDYIAPAPPAIGQGKFTTELTALMKHDSELQASLSGSFRSRDICKRLGYRAELDPKPVLGWDVTMGLCPGVRTITPRERILFGKRLKDVAIESAANRPAPDKSTDETSKSVVEENKIAAPVVVEKTAAIDGAIKEPTAEQSAPHARDHKPTSSQKQPEHAQPVSDPPVREYVEIGQYDDDQSAERAIRELTELGFPAAQTYHRQNKNTVRIIFAGPFKDPPDLNTALIRLRSVGYAQAVIR